jgi:hypothetical protein
MSNNIISKFICVSEEVEISKYETDLPYMILESNRMIGFYNSVPNERNVSIAHHYFLLMKKGIPCFQDRVFRSISFYENDSGSVLHVYPGHMNVHGEEYNFIRIRQSELEEVLGMLSYFEKRNIEFINKKRFSATRTLIQFKEMVNMEEIKPGIYRDMSAHHVFFLPISIDIEYLKFSKMITYIRNNCDFKHFEASLVYSVNSDYKIKDYAKIYSPNCEEHRLTEFDENFIKAANEFNYI